MVARALPVLGFALALLCAQPIPARAEPAGSDAWTERYARLLEGYTARVDAKVGTRVDYSGLLREPGWKAMIAALGKVDPAVLGTRAERLAFWINVYNVFAIDLVLRHYPVESIRDIGSFFRPVWKREAGRIDGRPYTLDEIEHEILRPMGEPRIHGAIVCASISCPDLRREPYRADALDDQLDDNMRIWLAHDDKGLAIDRAGGEIRLSRIFDWFEDDFDVRGGVLAVVTRHAPEPERAWLVANAERADITYFEYDWRLND